MNEIIISILGGLFRYFLMMLVGYLVTKGVIAQELSNKFTESPELGYYVSAAATAAVTVIWMFVNKARTKLNLDTALTLPAGSSKEELKDAVTAAIKTNPLTTMSYTSPRFILIYSTM